MWMSERRHDAVDGPADRPDAVALARGRDRKAGLDDVDAQPVELAGDLDLLLRVQRDAGRLLAVSERRVEDSDGVRF
jgi:hypothetical protein